MPKVLKRADLKDPEVPVAVRMPLSWKKKLALEAGKKCRTLSAQIKHDVGQPRGWVTKDKE